MMNNCISYGDVLEEISVFIATELARESIDKEIATQIAVGVTQKLRGWLGGQNLYIPKNTLRIKNQRDKEIFDAFDGGNYQALAIQYQVSEMRIRQIVAEERRKRKGMRDVQYAKVRGER